MANRLLLLKTTSFKYPVFTAGQGISRSSSTIDLSKRRNAVFHVKDFDDVENTEALNDSKDDPVELSKDFQTPPSPGTRCFTSVPVDGEADVTEEQGNKEDELTMCSTNTHPFGKYGIISTTTRKHSPVCGGGYYGPDADLIVMEKLVDDLSEFHHVWQELWCLLDERQIKRGVHAFTGTNISLFNEQCVQVHQCLENVLNKLISRYSFLNSSDVRGPADHLAESIKALNMDDGRLKSDAYTSKNQAPSLATRSHSVATAQEQEKQQRPSSGCQLPSESADKVAATAQAAVGKLQLAVAKRAGEYLTWEMAQDEKSLSKISQSSEELPKSTSGVVPRRQMSLAIANNANHRNRYCDSESSLSTTVPPCPLDSKITGVLEAPINVTAIPNHAPFKSSGHTTSTSCSSLSAMSTPHMYQSRNVKAPGIQRRHSAFQAGIKPDSSSDRIDRVLERLDDGVDLAFGRAKAWSKYCKEILNYVNRRISMETDHARAVQKLVESTQTAVEEEQFLPLQNVYSTSFKMEHEFFDKCADTMKRLYEYKFIKPLEARKLEQDRKRKELKTQWERCNKQLQDAASELKKSKQNFVARENNYKKARENSVKLELSSPDKSKIDKRRKMEEDAMIRRQQAAEDVRSLETRLEEKYEEQERMKAKILDEIRELIYQCDQTTKACTSAYFQAMADLLSPLPAQYQSLSECCRAYIPGNEYDQYIKQLPHNPETSRSHGRASSDDVLPSIAINGHKIAPPSTELRHKLSSPIVPFHAGLQSSSSFFDSGDELGSVNSYYDAAAVTVPAACTGSPAKAAVSGAALTHRLQKVRLPTKCCHCDSYTFFQTVQCSECCMTWHKQCLSSLDVPCDVAKKMVSGAIQRRMSTRIFGAPLPQDGAIPNLLQNCVSDLEKRGCTVKGLYRVCGVKSKIEELCEQFERDNVDFSEVHPTNVASVVKLYLRQLPEPILTLKLYPQFVALAKEFPAGRITSPGQASIAASIIRDIKSILQQLPKANYDTVKFLILHLHRLTWFETENQMSAGNLGIVFGPTLLRRDDDRNSQASMNSLLEAPLQTRAIELLIEYAYEVFDLDRTPDMERLGVTNRKALPTRTTGPGKSVGPDEGESNAGPGPHLGLEEDEVIPPRTSTTPDLLKGSRSVHDRSLSIPASSSSEFTPESPDDSPERKMSNGNEWRNLLASAASHEQRLHQTLTAPRCKPIGRRRATSPAQLKSFMTTIRHEPVEFKAPSKPDGTKVPVASPESCGATPVSTPSVPEFVGSPFHRAKGAVVRRVSSQKGILVKRSASACRQIAVDDDSDGELRKNDEKADVERRSRKPAQALKRSSAPGLEKKPFQIKIAPTDATKGKRSSDSAAYDKTISYGGAVNDRRGPGGSTLHRADLTYNN